MKRLLSTLSQKWPDYLIEGAVITVSILGAIALENWNDDRKDRIKEKVFLEEIHDEFTQNRAQFDSIVNKHKINYEGCLRMTDQMPFSSSTRLDQNDLDNLYQSYTFNPSQSSIRALMNSSSFDLISNKKLRKLLVSWPDMIADYQEEEVMLTNFQKGILFEYTVEHAYQFQSQTPDLKSIVGYLTIIGMETGILEDIVNGDELANISTVMDSIIYYSQPRFR
jgi:hypothetical protein